MATQTSSTSRRKRSKRKALRQDRLITFYARAWGFFDEHRKLVYGALAGLVVLVLLAIGYVYYLSQQQEEAQRLLGEIISVYEAGDYQQALEGTGEAMGLIEIADTYGAVQAGNLATFYAADALYHLGEYDRALEYFQAFEAEENILGASALAGQAAVYEDQGQYAQAAEYYLRAADLYASAATTPYYLLDAARAYEAAGNYEAAIDTYQRIEADYPDAPPAQAIEQNIARVRAKS